MGYVEPLIGAHTVNTMPAATAAAFADHGKPGKNLTRAVPSARKALKDLKVLGIDLKRVTWQLENEGIQKFIEPFEKLIGNIEAKRQALAGPRTGRVTPSVDLGRVMAYRRFRNWRFWSALDLRRLPFGIFHD